MKNIGSEQPFSEGLPSVFTVIEQGGKSPKTDGNLLELRTEDGPVFVRPSTWQRIRLRRAFRYFHVVPPQLLSRSHQRLIAKLLRTAVVTPNPSVAKDAVFGVVQNVHAPSAGEGLQVVVERPEPPRALAFLPPPAIHIAAPPERQPEYWGVTSPPPALAAREAGLWPWIVSGAAAAVCIPLIMASVYGISRFSSTPRVKGSHPASTQVAQGRTPKEVHPVAIPPAPALLKMNLQTPKHQPAAHPLLAAHNELETDPSETTALLQPRFVSELPPGYFAHPVVGTPNLVGEVRLKALIGVDGAVKSVTVLSGNPKLARAAMRAVMRWHYHPYQVLGDPVAVETGVKMNFFGPDAVSIASIADGSPSPRK